MRFPFRKSDKSDKSGIDYLSLSLKEKLKLIGIFCLKWGGVILIVEVLIWILLDVFTDYIGIYFFGYSLFYIPGALLIIGGCMGGLSRYNAPPSMRIIEPDDQAVTPDEFQIRVKYDENRVVPETIEILVNGKTIPVKKNLDNNIIQVPKVFKTPPTKAVSLVLEAQGRDINDKEVKDKIRVICDPESDEEDYLYYWEFKREDETYWGKEMISAAKHAKRNLNAIKLIALAVILVLLNYIVSVLFQAIVFYIFLLDCQHF